MNPEGDPEGDEQSRPQLNPQQRRPSSPDKALVSGTEAARECYSNVCCNSACCDNNACCNSACCNNSCFNNAGCNNAAPKEGFASLANENTPPPPNSPQPPIPPHPLPPPPLFSVISTYLDAAVRYVTGGSHQIRLYLIVQIRLYLIVQIRLYLIVQIHHTRDGRPPPYAGHDSPPQPARPLTRTRDTLSPPARCATEVHTPDIPPSRGT